MSSVDLIVLAQILIPSSKVIDVCLLWVLVFCGKIFLGEIKHMTDKSMDNIKSNLISLILLGLLIGK